VNPARQAVTVTITVNGVRRTATAGGHLSLLRWLREEAGVTDPKYGCGEGVCGACAVLVDGLPAASCIVLAAQVDGCEVTTAAGLCGPGGSLGPLQQAFHASHAAQCGFCTPGMLVCAAAMLAEGRPLDRQEIRDGLHGNICRCTGYGPIVSAISSAQDQARDHARGEGRAGGAGP
jgi:carbon-monoxide dehydrogenase small subunit